MSMSNRIRAFVRANFFVPDPESLRDCDSLHDAGIVDCTGVVEIIAFLESEFGIRVEDSEIAAANLDSIERIDAFVMRKLSAAATTPPDVAKFEAQAPAE